MPTVDTPRITATGTYPRITVNVVTGATGPGGGAVDSVNGETGVVVLDAGDVGALPDDTVIPDITGLQATSEKNQPNGYAGLDGDGTIPNIQLPASIATALAGKVPTSRTLAGLDLTANRSDSDLRTALGLGSAALQASSAFDAAGAASTAQTYSVQRANHTGTQAQSTVTDLVSDLAAKAPATRTVGTGLSTSGTVNLDMAAVHGTIQTITASGNITFTSSNRAAGREVTLIIAAGGSTRTLAWPAWIAVGAALPTSLASGKTLVVTVTFVDTTDAAAIAASSVQP